MDAVKLFRAFIVASFVLFCLSIALAFIGPETPDEVVSFLATQSLDPLQMLTSSESPAALITTSTVLVLFLGAYLASLAGMLGYKPWARTLYIVTTAISLLMLPLGGASFSFRWQATADSLYWMVDGALLVLLFVEPVRSRFSPRVPA